MFNKGDKVRNKVSGDVATYVAIVESTKRIRVSFRHGADDSNTADWLPKDCEPHFERIPVSAEEQPPEESDYDSNGLLFVKRHGYSWRDEHINHFDNDDDPDVNLWMHTPDWKPRNPLLESCKECEHWGHVGKTYTTPVCWKHKKEAPEPFYKGDTPCHLED